MSHTITHMTRPMLDSRVENAQLDSMVERAKIAVLALPAEQRSDSRVYTGTAFLYPEGDRRAKGMSPGAQFRSFLDSMAGVKSASRYLDLEWSLKSRASVGTKNAALSEGDSRTFLTCMLVAMAYSALGKLPMSVGKDAAWMEGMAVEAASVATMELYTEADSIAASALEKWALKEGRSNLPIIQRLIASRVFWAIRTVTTRWTRQAEEASRVSEAFLQAQALTASEKEEALWHAFLPTLSPREFDLLCLRLRQEATSFAQKKADGTETTRVWVKPLSRDRIMGEMRITRAQYEDLNRKLSYKLERFFFGEEVAAEKAEARKTSYQKFAGLKEVRALLTK